MNQAREIFTVIDFETTGLDASTNQVIEIAALKTDGIREIGRYHTLVALINERTLPPFITELTGITSDDLNGATKEWDALESLKRFTKYTTVIAHNAPFDLSFASVVFEPRSFVCTRALSKLVEPTVSSSLKDVCARHGIALDGHHRAMNDVLATLDVFKLMRAKAEALGIEYRNVVVETPDRPLTFVPKYAQVIRINERGEVVLTL